MKKYSSIAISVFLVVVLSAVALVGCGDDTTGTTASTATTASTETSASTADTGVTESTAPEAGSTTTLPVEKYKIGVVTFDPTDLSQAAIFKYLTGYLGPELNVEFVISQAIVDSNDEFSFYENCAAQGVKGILNLYTASDWRMVFQKMQELEMYFVLPQSPMPDEEIEFAADNPYIVGGIGTSGDYEGFKQMTQSFLDAGARSLVVASGGKDFGVQMFIDRFQGVQDAVAEFEAANPGVEIKVTDFGGFPNDPAFFATQGQMIASDPDAVIATFSGDYLWVQPLKEAGKAGQIMLGTYTSMNEVSTAAAKDGTLNFLVATYPEQIAPAVALLYNHMSGNGNDFRMDGKAVSVEQPMVTWQSPDDVDKWQAVLNAEEPPYTGEDLRAVIKAFNPAATLEDLVALAEACTYEDIVARRGK